MAGVYHTGQSDDPLFSHNHLTSVRWVLAGFVALGHLWLLTTAYEPFRIHDWTGGYMAVNGFFVLSGLLIAKSLHTRGDLKSYAQSRFLRIYPALIVMGFAFALIFAPFFSEPGGLARIWDTETWRYVFRVWLMGNPEQAPGGIFAGSLEEDFNGPLWTIRFEMAAYILAALGFFLGLVTTFWRILCLYLSVQIAYLVAPHFVDFSALPAGALSLLRLSSAFLMGMVLWHWPRARRPHLAIVAGLIAFFFLFGTSPIGEWIANLALAGIMLRAGLSKRRIERLVKLPDYSYGIYIWHYPVMQGVLFVQPDLGPYWLAVFSVPLFIGLSALSWHIVEKPALKLKRPKKPKAVLVYESEGAL